MAADEATVIQKIKQSLRERYSDSETDSSKQQPEGEEKVEIIARVQGTSPDQDVSRKRIRTDAAARQSNTATTASPTRTGVNRPISQTNISNTESSSFPLTISRESVAREAYLAERLSNIPAEFPSGADTMFRSTGASFLPSLLDQHQPNTANYGLRQSQSSAYRMDSPLDLSSQPSRLTQSNMRVEQPPTPSLLDRLQVQCERQALIRRLEQDREATLQRLRLQDSLLAELRQSSLASLQQQQLTLAGNSGVVGTNTTSLAAASLQRQGSLSTHSATGGLQQQQQDSLAAIARMQRNQESIASGTDLQQLLARAQQMGSRSFPYESLLPEQNRRDNISGGKNPDNVGDRQQR